MGYMMIYIHYIIYNTHCLVSTKSPIIIWGCLLWVGVIGNCINQPHDFFSQNIMNQSWSFSVNVKTRSFAIIKPIKQNKGWA